MGSIHEGGPGSRPRPPTGSRPAARAAALLERCRDELETVIAVAGVGYCRLDRDLNVLTASALLRAELGLAFDGPLDWSAILGRVHPEDRDALSSAVCAAFEPGAGLALRVRTVTGAELSLSGRATLDAAGGARELVLVARSVTAPEDEDLDPARALEAAGCGAFAWNPCTDETVWSARHAALYGLAPDAAPRTGEEWLDHVHPEDRARLADFLDALRAGRAPVDLELRIVRPDGSVRWLWTKAGPVPDAAGEPRVAGVAAELTARLEIAAQATALLERERQLRAAAEHENRAKDEFLSVFSHELRSPLNAILGWNRILALKRADDREIAEATLRIERAAQSLLRLANDLLDLGRVATGKLRFEPRPVNLAAVVGAAVDAARPAAEAKRVTIATDLEAGRVTVRADPDRIQQVVMNLLSNATKFTGAGGHVGVTLRRRGEWIELEVSDDGEGIAPELLPHVFDRFRQGDTSASRTHRGLGIGLALVREIVALHGGRVKAHSEGVGRGTTLTVTLPVRPGDSVAETRGPFAQQASAPQGALAGLSILVVDDEADARAVIAESLRLEGATVAACDSVASAMGQLLTARFDVVISDIGMPEEDGYSLVRRLRRLPGAERVTAIALTGYAAARDVETAIEAGFDLHVAKPVDFERFVPLIRRLATGTRLLAASGRGEQGR